MTTGSFEMKAEQTGTERPVNPAAEHPKPDANARPEWLDSKFKTPEQMAESYKHLEAELTRLRQGKAPDPAPKQGEELKLTADAEAPKGDEQPKTDAEKKAEEVADQLKSDGLDIDGMNARFWEKGEIVPEDRTKLVEALKDKFGDNTEKLIDTFAQAQKEAFEYREFRVHEPMGGKDKSGEMIAWAKANLPLAQKEAINSMWESNDVNKMAEGSRMVATLYAQANGTKPARVLDGSPAPAGEAGYASEAEMRADMSDPRYKTDTAFQRKVVEKLSKTTAF